MAIKTAVILRDRCGVTSRAQ